MSGDHELKLLKGRYRNTTQTSEYKFRVLKYKFFAKDDSKTKSIQA